MVSSKDVQRLFLQAVFSRRILSVDLAQTIWSKCVEAVKTANESLEIRHSKERVAWDKFVGDVNESLNSLDLEFRHLHDEVSGREMYALVNRKADVAALIATQYSSNEISFFKAIVEQIMLAPRETYSVSSLAALREVNHLKTIMTKTQGEVVLNSFVAKGWLLKSKDGRYSLSTRSLLELLPFLREEYPDEIIECTICMEVITRGVACHTLNCKTRMHFHCFTTFRRRHSSCPACSEAWPENARSKPLVLVGEEAAGPDQGRRRRRKSMAEGSGEEEDEDELDQSQPSQTQAQTQTQTQTQKGKKKAKVSFSATVLDDEDGPSQPQNDGKRRSRR